MIGTAESNGIPWRQRAGFLEKQQDRLEKYLESTFGPAVETISYPEYYTQAFHAYDLGNLNWQAAFECESATMSMALRVWPKEGLTAEAAQDRLRSSFLDAIENYVTSTTNKTPISPSSSSNKNISFKKIIDIGCSVGVSTFYLADHYRQCPHIDGFDLSPYFLSVAKERQATVLAGGKLPSEMGKGTTMEAIYNADMVRKFQDANVGRINWKFGNAEATDLDANSYDLTAVSFLFHELPQDPSRKILQELYRITTPGGIVAITDNNPKSSVIQNLPPAIFTLMKSTEPHSDEYYSFNLEDAMRAAGFEDVQTLETDPRHRTILGRKPSPKINNLNNNKVNDNLEYRKDEGIPQLAQAWNKVKSLFSQ